MKYLKTFKQINEDHYVPENIVREYESKIFRKTSYGIGISVVSLKEYLEKYFSVTFSDSSDLQMMQPEQGRFSLEIQLSSKAEMIDSLTWRKLAEEFSEFEYVEDTSEDTNKNRFILDLREGIEYDLEVKENISIEEEINIKTRNPLASQILRRAVMGKFISLEDANNVSIKGVAEEVADSHRDDEEIGSSDFTFILKEFLDGLGLKTDFPNGKGLTIVGGQIDPRYKPNKIPAKQDAEKLGGDWNIGKSKAAKKRRFYGNS